MAALGPLYSIAAALVAILGLLVLRHVRWGLVVLFAVIGIAPFAALPFKVGFTPTFLDIAMLALYVVWILRVVTGRQRDVIGSPLGLSVAVFFVLALFAFANGMRFNRPTATAVRNFAELMLGILFFFLLVNNLRRSQDLRFLTRLILLAGAAAAAIAIVFYVIPSEWTVRVLDGLSRFNYPGGAGALRYIEDDPANPMRAIGLQIDPNVLGGFMVLMAALAAPQLATPRPVFRRRYIAAILLLDFVALYLTHSRGSMVGLAAAFGLLGLLRYRRLLVYGIVAAALIMLLPPAQTYVGHFLEGILLQDRATLMRLGEYKDALALVMRYPWFGVGFTGSPDADLYVGVSNLYLLMAEEMGALGVAWFLVVIFIFFVQIWTAWRRTTDSGLEAILLGAGAGVAAALVGGIFDHYLFNLVYPHMSALLWIYLALGISAVLQVRQSQTPVAKPDPKVYVLE